MLHITDIANEHVLTYNHVLVSFNAVNVFLLVDKTSGLKS